MSANLINYSEKKTNNFTSANAKIQYPDRMVYAKADASAITQIINVILSEFGASERTRVTIQVLHGLAGNRKSFKASHSLINNQLQKLENLILSDSDLLDRKAASQRIRRRVKEILNLEQDIAIKIITYKPGDYKPGSTTQGESSEFELPIVEMAFEVYSLAKQDPEFEKNKGKTLERVAREFARKLLEEAKAKRQPKTKDIKDNPINQQLSAINKLEKLLPTTDKNISIAIQSALKASINIAHIAQHIEVFRDSIFELSNLVLEELHSHKSQNEGHLTGSQGGDILVTSKDFVVESQLDIEVETDLPPFKSEGVSSELVLENQEVSKEEIEVVPKCRSCDGVLSFVQEVERLECSSCFSKLVSNGLDVILVGKEIEGLLPVSTERIYQALHMLASFVSVGAVAFFLLLKDKDNVTKVACRKSLVADLLINNIDRLLAACDKWQVSLIIRPILPLGYQLQFLQLDDLSKQVALSENLVLLSLLTLETSKDNYQSWVAVKNISEEEKKLIRGKLIEQLGADIGATGAVRLAGSYNFKPEYESDIPVIKLVDYETALTVSIEQLRESGFVKAKVSPPCDSSCVLKGGNLKWYSYEKSLSKAPFKKDGVTPDYSVADIDFVLVNLAQGFPYELVEEELARIRRDKVIKNPVYLKLTMSKATEYLRKKRHPLFV